jgi:hypothetical protein
MEIPDQALDEFMTIYAEEFGEAITHAQASEIAQRVLALYRLMRQALSRNTISTDAMSK